jgi:hypothetical protein
MDAARPLKVLSSEMDLAETRFKRKAFIRERRAERFLEKSACSPSFESSLKINQQLYKAL